jgi:DNA gyrase subunit A
VKLINIGADKDIKVASFAKVRESSANSEEDVLKKLEEELQEENVPVIADENEEFDETSDLDNEVLENEDELSEIDDNEDTTDLDELVKRALEDREE